MNKNINYKCPKGTIDYFNLDSKKLKFMKNNLENIFEKYGGECVETPVFELKDTIMGKYGEEAETKLIYEISDNGGEKLVLRYDLTVPFIRFLIENKIKKIKRYSIGKVYRRDNPNVNQGRYREFYQADFDIVGEDNTTMMAECVIFKMISEILEVYKINNYKIIINDTDNLKEVLINKLGIETNNFKNICSSIDKLDKVTFTEIIPELKLKGLTDNQIVELSKIIKLNEIYSEKSKERINKINNITKIWNINDNIEYNFSLARGLDYYNGIIYEVKLLDFNSSVIAGGRYDNIIDNTTFIGFSVGLTRLLNMIKFEDENKWKLIYNLTCLGDISLEDKLRIIKYVQDNISKNNTLNYSFDKEKKLGKIIRDCVIHYEKYLIIISEDELKENKFILKDLENNTQILIDIPKN
jgi:histidyl-tRNA synthetase